MDTLLRAARDGDVHLLYRNQGLLENFLVNPYINGAPPSSTPLHIASLYGQRAFVVELLCLKPELTETKDSQELLPIHLAAARGHPDIVMEMLQYNPRLGTIANRDGRNAVHLAAACGRVEVIEKMLIFDGSLAEEVSEVYEETILHTSVRHGQLDVVRFICDNFEHLVNRKDCNGNTALHIAAEKRNAQIVKYLLKGIPNLDLDVNTKNNHGYTALDLALQSDMGYVDKDFCQMMTYMGARRGRGPTTNDASRREPRLRDEERKTREKVWFKEVQNTILIIATVIVGATFQSGIEHATGTSLFRLFNAFSMGTSMALILFLASGATLKHWVTTRLLLMLLWVSLSSMGLAYGAFILHKNENKENRSKIATGFLAIFICLLAVTFIGHLTVLVARVVWNVVRKLRKWNEVHMAEGVELGARPQPESPLIYYAAQY